MDVPNVGRQEYALLDIDDGFMSLMLNVCYYQLISADSFQDGSTKDDVRLPEGELGTKIQGDFDDGKELLVTVITAMGEEAAISYKEAPKS